ncbi:hypothetical protein, partial [Sulfitobacter sp. HI0021]
AQRMHDFFAEFSHDITVIGYSRPPSDFITSAYQQNLKIKKVSSVSRNDKSPQLEAVLEMPRYRARFEKIDRIFGRDAVRLREFSRESLFGSDVVQDFAHEISVAPLAEDQILRTNESLSLEAVALLYLHRKLSGGFVSGFKRAAEANMAFISRLATIGRRKFAFSPQMLAPILEKERDDIAWMEERLGHPFSEAGTAHPDAIGSLDDLTVIALKQYDTVQELLGKQATSGGQATTETLVHALERLRENCYLEVLNSASQRRAKIASRFLIEKGKSTMKATTDRPEPTEAELNIRRKLAHVLWIQENENTLPEDMDARKEMFQSSKVGYL